MPNLSARHRSARRRIAMRAAAGAAAIAFVLVAWPVLAVDSTKTVLYSCTALGDTAATATYPVNVALHGPESPAPGETVKVTWQIAPASPSGDGQATMLAGKDIAPSDVIAADGVMEVTGTPIVAATGTPTPSDSVTPTPSDSVTPTPSDSLTPTPSHSVTPTPSESATSLTPSPTDTSETTSPAVATTLTPVASAAATTTVSSMSTLSPIPDLVVTLTPTVAGVVGVAAGNFGLKLVPSGGSATSSLYNCTLPSTATRASLAFTVVSSSSTPTPSGSDGTTETPTPDETVTVTETVSATATVSTTVSQTVTAQVRRTPRGGAQTGGGGDIGPDGRVLVLAGTALVLASATGGLMLRRRIGVPS